MVQAPNSDPVNEVGSMRAPPAKPKRSAAWYSMAFFLSILTCVLFYETMLLITVGMLPTGVAYLIDTHPQRYATKTVAWANLAGTLIVVFELWDSERTLATTFELLTDPMNWVIMLSAAGVGWGIRFTVPGLVMRYLDVSLEIRRKTLREKQKELEKEWGMSVRANAPLKELAAVGALPESDEKDEKPETEPEND